MALLVTAVMAQPENKPGKSHAFGVYNAYDLRNSSTNALTVNQMTHTAFRKHVKPLMNEKMGNIAYDVFSFAATYMSLVWSHEFGHSLRAAQVGGEFRIHNMALPIPYTTMHLPDSITLVNESLSVTGGFEVNYLNARAVQRDFIWSNGSSNENLAFAFVNRIMFPLYTTVIVPIDPEERDVWINTAGDPVHVILPVFKNYSNGQVFMDDGSVNPELVDFYGEMALLGMYFNFLDPQFYKEMGAALGKKVDRKPTYLIGDETNGWTYGTLFNTSPLGYELYLNNYINFRGQELALYFKTGRPFKNNGLGLTWNELYTSDKLEMSATVEAWDQDLFGSGFAGELETYIGLTEQMGIVLNTGYKTEGYVLGKQVDSGLNLGLGVRYSND